MKLKTTALLMLVVVIVASQVSAKSPEQRPGAEGAAAVATVSPSGVVVVDSLEHDLTRVWLLGKPGDAGGFLLASLGRRSVVAKRECGPSTAQIGEKAWWGACGAFCLECELEALQYCQWLTCPLGDAWCFDYSCCDAVHDPTGENCGMDPGNICDCANIECWCC